MRITAGDADQQSRREIMLDADAGQIAVEIEVARRIVTRAGRVAAEEIAARAIDIGDGDLAALLADLVGKSGRAVLLRTGRRFGWAEGKQPADLPRADPKTDAPVKPRDVFAYFITEGKVRAPFGAMALMKRVAA